MTEGKNVDSWSNSYQNFHYILSWQRVNVTTWYLVVFVFGSRKTCFVTAIKMFINYCHDRGQKCRLMVKLLSKFSLHTVEAEGKGDVLVPCSVCFWEQKNLLCDCYQNVHEILS